MPAELRLLPLLAAAAFAVGLLAPVSAPAGQGRTAHATKHKAASNERCVLERKQRSGHLHSTLVCTKKKPVKSRHTSDGATEKSSAGVEVTPLEVPLGSTPPVTSRSGRGSSSSGSTSAPPASSGSGGGGTQTTDVPLPPLVSSSNPSLPISAQAEGFAGQTADVLLSYSQAVEPSVASGCTAYNSAGGSEAFGGVEQGPTPETVRLQLIPGGQAPVEVECKLSAEAGGPAVDVLAVAAAAATSGGVLSDPIDPAFLTDVPFGASSFWLQPWRAYLDTWPASRLLEAVGVNFNVEAPEAEDTARLLQESGFTLARKEIGWGKISYGDPSTLLDEGNLRTELTAMRNHGLRPLILLNSNSTRPAPSKNVNLETVSEAPTGAQTVTLTAASAAAVVPGKTGFDQLTFAGDPSILITSVSASDVATLSRPLTKPLAAGPHAGATLLYAPFSAPTLANGEPNPAYEATLSGWLSYVATVNRFVASVVGAGNYDLEIWNELDFGSQFLNSEHYDRPGGPEGSAKVTHAVTQALLAATVAFVRNPANGIPATVGITNGFASQSPFPSGAQAPVGLTALSKHPYAGVREYPAEYKEHHIRPINALGERDTAKKSFTPKFIPTYQSLLPEFTLTAGNTATIIRDLAPFTTDVYGDPHGREVGPEGGSPLQKWVTEYNLSSTGATPMAPDEVTPESSVTPTPADKAHFQAKALLRSLVSMVSKGVSREYFFQAARHGAGLNILGENFTAAVEAEPNVYPGKEAGGETLTGMRNLLTQFQGPGPGGATRQLTLDSIAQEGEHAQFSGDGTAAHPDLYDREVLAVFPFQASPTRFVIPVYVMTRDLLTLYELNQPASDIYRYDLPSENFRITLGNLPETGTAPTVSAYDPLHNESTPARLITRSGSSATFEIAATDYPRILTLEYG